MTQFELGKQIGVSLYAISRWELGTAELNIFEIKQLSEYFDVTVDYLLFGENLKKPVLTYEQYCQEMTMKLIRCKNFIFETMDHCNISDCLANEIDRIIRTMF